MWRYLAENKTSEGPRHIFSVDTETVREPHPTDDSWAVEKLRLGVVRYCRLENGRRGSQVALAFRTGDEFWDFIERHSERRGLNWIFAHGLGFDLRALGWQQCIDSGRLLLRQWRLDKPRSTPGKPATKPETGLLVLDGVPTIVESWLRNGGRLRMCDTRNWWHCKLSEVGDSVGLPKLEMPDPWASDDVWLEYCTRDCEIVEEAVVGLCNWTRNHDLGVFKPTAAGQSMQAFRHRFHHKKVVLHDAVSVKRLERDAYYAGRLAIFYAGKVESTDRGVNGMLFDKFSEDAPEPSGTVYKLDVNSLFPSVMRANLFPCKLLRWNLTPSDSPKTLPGQTASTVATVLLKNACESYPVRREGQLLYAGGNFVTTLAGPELSRASMSGSTAECVSWAEYQTAELFTEFVDFFVDLRNQAKRSGNALEARLCKLIANSLYGKFAQRSFEWEALPRMHPPEPWSQWCAIDAELGKIREYRSIGELVQARVERGDHPNSFTAISAWVTSFARLRMDQLRETSGYHNVYYQGVDSLFVSRLGLDRLQAAGEVADSELGKLRLEGESDLTQFLAKGVYYFNGQWTRVGVSGNAVQVAGVEYRQDEFQGLAEACRSEPIDGVRVRQRHCRLMTDPASLDLTPAGWVRPRVLEQCVSPQELCVAN